MPFTPSHAVVALPFLRSPLVPAAIAVGAMTPDLPLFVRGLSPSYGMTHDLVWIPLTVVIALALLILWRCVLRPATRELTPTWVADRLPTGWDRCFAPALGETFPSGRGVVLLLASLVVGVASHIVWDLFTHEGRWGSDLVPVLDDMWGPLTGYKWLQHGSSVLGLSILAIWAVVWLRRRRPGPIDRLLPAWVRWTWWMTLPAFLVAAWLFGLGLYGGLTEEFTAAHLAYRVLPPACALWGIQTVALCVLIQVLRRRRTPDAA